MATGLFNLKQQLQGLIQKAWTGTQKTNYVEYLVVAGGGGANNGGGGAGGLLQGIVPVTTGSAITITIGGGGAGAICGTSSNGANGQNSVFGSITAIGGGGGADQTSSSAGGSNGGSGGGQGYGRTTASNYYAGQGVAGQGNAGSLGYSDLTTYTKGGGGGGAGTISPYAGVNNNGGNGGAGIASSINGTVTAYAGGGGGATSGVNGLGGVGGGGAGVYSGTSNSGTANTGGGAGANNQATGGTGGSGIVIISYPDIYNAPTAFGGANSPTASTSGSGSLSFNGTSQYISTPASTNYVFGTGDFTVECWMYMTSTTGSPVLIDQFNSPNGWQLYTNSSQNVIFYTPNTNQTTTTFSLNTWNHIAISRNSNTLKIYINGVQGYSGTDSTNLTANNALFVGAQHVPNSYFAGYISNVRIVKGTGLYPSAFTPSTIPLTAVSGTSLLLSTVSASQFADSSGNNAIFTATGSPTWNQASPFATGLGYKNRVYTWTGSGTVTF